ncbi:putative photosynthetic complex assembly protein PuhE [Altererythrobacter sp. GH1-8]|uniref:putative photosynthetic complex assembly protein PuhE n=1 Tax=Altererythrobacter sp. GH1-8 TaxID=3349333 RepID=UPI00374C9B65
MVSWSGHILPVLVTIAIWFLATGLIAWVDNRSRTTFPRSLVLAGCVGIAGLGLIWLSMASTASLAIYASFAGALMVWAWHEVSFLTGAAAGPRREACPEGSSGFERFVHASMTVIYHEVALLLSALILISLTWNAVNQIGAMTFALLYGLRLSAKLCIYAGVPNTYTDILPPHLGYLRSYYGANRLSSALVIALLAIAAVSLSLGQAAYGAQAGSAEAIGASLLFALACLGLLEHFFLALPFRDGALWGWALPQAAARSGTTVSNRSPQSASAQTQITKEES